MFWASGLQRERSAGLVRRAYVLGHVADIQTAASCGDCLHAAES